MFSARFMSNFIVKFYNSFKTYNYKKQKIIILSIHSYKKQKNKFYVVKTTYGSIANIYNYKKHKK